MDKEIVEVICKYVFGCVCVMSAVGLIGFLAVASSMRKDDKK